MTIQLCQPNGQSTSAFESAEGALEETLAKIRQTLFAGEPKTVVVAVQTLIPKIGATGNDRLLAAAHRLLLVANTMLGHYDEGETSLRLGMEAAFRSGEEAEICAFLSIEPAIPFFRGDYLVAAERAVHNLQRLRASERDEPRCLFYLASSFLRLGDLERAERHAIEGISLPPHRQIAHGPAVLSIRLGDIAWWRIVAAKLPQLAITRATPEVSVDVLRENAIRYYSRALESTERDAPYFARFARNGLAKTHALGRYDAGLLSMLAEHMSWLSSHHLFLDTLIARLHLAIVLSAHSLWHGAWAWIRPMVSAADTGFGRPFDVEALRLAACIRKNLGDDRAEASYLLRAAELADVRGRELVALATRIRDANTPRSGSATEPARSDLLMAIRSKVYERLATPIDVGKLCAAVGIPRRTLENTCRATFRHSPKEMIDILRLEEARARMHAQVDRGGATIARIAGDVGFSSYKAFLRAYKRQYGATPRQIRHPQEADLH